jgi:hypothetical protein
MKTRFTILFVFLTLTGFSQMEFAPIGAEWYYCLPDPESGNPLASYEKFVVKKDTTIEGKTCKIIESQHSSEIMYEENGKVFYRFRNNFKLIYDFTANEGDTIEFEFKSHSANSYIIDTTYQVFCLVTKVEPEIIDNKKIRRFFTSVIKHDSLNHVLWPKYYNYQEKIGFEYEFIYTIPIPSVDGQHTLRCYQDSDVHYATAWWKLIDKPCDYEYLTLTNQVSTMEWNVFPNPASDKLTILQNQNTPYEQFRIKLSDCSGKILNESFLNLGEHNIEISTLPKGLYFLFIFNDSNYKSFKIIKI